MRVKGVGDVEVVGDKGLKRVFEEVFLCARGLACDLDVGASVEKFCQLMSVNIESYLLLTR